jgi:hypothetical protein
VLDSILIGHLADLDDSALMGIINSSASQASYLSRFPADAEASAMAGVCSIIATAAESALLFRQTGIQL